MTDSDSLEVAAVAPSFYLRSVPRDIIFTVLTLGLFNLVVQYRQMQALNCLLKEKKYSFGLWAIFCLLTFGLYFIYYEYQKANDVRNILGDLSSDEPLITVLLTVLGLHVVADAIHQVNLNRYFEGKKTH